LIFCDEEEQKTKCKGGRNIIIFKREEIMNFYDVTKDYIEKMEYLELGINAETGEISEDKNQLAIWNQELTQDLKNKSANIIAVVRNQELTIEALDTEIERLKGLKKLRENQLNKFKDYIKNVMLVNQIEKIDTVLGTIKFTKSTSTEIYDESLIDKKFIEIVTTEKISKEKIKSALKAGEEVQGARLIVNKNLKVG
jgi:gp157